MKTKKNEEVANTKIGNMQLYSKYLNDLKNKIEKQENVVVNKRIDVDKSKEELVEASKEKKIFERLKENKHEEYLYLENYRKTKLLTIWSATDPTPEDRGTIMEKAGKIKSEKENKI